MAVCSLCGVASEPEDEPAPLGWMLEVDGRTGRRSLAVPVVRPRQRPRHRGKARPGVVVTGQSSAPAPGVTWRTSARGRAAWAGVLAAAVALGVAELVSALIEGTDNPVVSVGEVGRRPRAVVA